MPRFEPTSYAREANVKPLRLHVFGIDVNLNLVTRSVLN